MVVVALLYIISSVPVRKNNHLDTLISSLCLTFVMSFMGNEHGKDGANENDNEEDEDDKC